MALESGIYRRHRTSFVLDADTLSRIEGILKKGTRDYGEHLGLVYHVEREGHRFYETHSVDDVISDPNALTKRVNLLAVELRSTGFEKPNLERGPRKIVSLTFDNQRDGPSYFGRDVVLKISSPNRTWALLIADELEPQIQRTLKGRRTPRWLLYLFLIPAGVGIYRTAPLLKTTDFTPDEHFSFTILILLLAVLIALFYTFMARIDGPPKWFTKCFGPESVFLWGNEIQEYGEREQFRNNLQWVVIVGFFVSLGAGLVSLWF